MSLERYRLKPESLRINIKVLVSDEEEIVLFSSPEPAEPWENHRLSDHQNILEAGKKIIDKMFSGIFADIVRLGI